MGSSKNYQLLIIIIVLIFMALIVVAVNSNYLMGQDETDQKIRQKLTESIKN